MDAPIVVRFPHVTIEVWSASHVRTIFSDGLALPASPRTDAVGSAAQRETAHEHGYTSVARMVIEHEITHSLLAWLDDLSYSPALRAAALERDEDHGVEEERVLSYQKLQTPLLQLTMQLLMRSGL